MANIVITSETNSFKLDFGVYSGQNGFPKKSCFSKTDVSLHLNSAETYVDFKVRGSLMYDLTWDITNANPNFSIVDSVNGAAPSSNDDLFEKLCTAKNT